MRLREYGGLFRVYAGGNQESRDFPYFGLENLGILWNRDSMQVYHTIYAIKFGLYGDPMLDGAQVVAYMYIPCWLNTRKYTLFFHLSPFVPHFSKDPLSNSLQTRGLPKP